MTDIEPTVQAGRERRLPAGLRSTVVSVVIAALVMIAALVYANHEADAYFVFSPGTAPVVTTSARCTSRSGEQALPDGTPCVRLDLPEGRSRAVTGRVLMVDVEVGQASIWQWAAYQLGRLGADEQMVPVAAYTGVTPTSELGCQDTQEMLSANEDAALAALATVGYHVQERALGAELTGVVANSPAWDAGLKCNDLITAVDGTKVTTAVQVTSLLADKAPGDVVSVTDKPASGGPAKVFKARLGTATATERAYGFNGQGFLGVQLSTRFRPQLPFRVSVDAGAIGGPSAGLAFTLAIIDALSNGHLTGGHRVAATGTIDPSGAVGDVGGVQEKTVAVERAGAQVFFVPKPEYSAAANVAGKGLAVVPVTSLGQVLRILHERYGGDISGLTLGG